MSLLPKTEVEKWLSNLDSRWQLSETSHSKPCLTVKYQFPDFLQALEWVNAVGKVAEKQFHHPNISFTWGVVHLQIWTHDAGGLTEKDFQLATELDAIWK